MDEMTKRLIKEANRARGKEDYFHSSGYAKAQQGAHIGAAGAGQTFKERQKMVREFVGKYDDSQLTREAAGRRQGEVKSFTPEAAGEPSVGAQRWQAIQEANAKRAEAAKAAPAGGPAGAGAANGAKK